MRRTLVGPGTLALVLLAALPAAAGAASIVYIKDSNVWIAAPDGTGAYQVTLDGTPDYPYSSPSQANGGALMAIKGTGTAAKFHHLRQNGDLIDPPFDHSAPAHPHDAQLSPNGAMVAYHWIALTNSCYPYTCIAGYPKTFVSHSNRFTPGEEITSGVNFQNPAWMSDSRLYLSYGASNTYTYDLGAADATQWFGNSETTVYDPDLDAANSRIVVIGDRDSGNPEKLRFFRTNGAPPAEPSLSLCGITNPVGGAFDDPTWAPDGTRLAWGEGDGIWTSTVNFDAPTCDGFFTGMALTIPGGSEPDWGPADVNPGPRTPPRPAPTPPPPATGSPTPAPGANTPAANSATELRYALLSRRSIRGIIASGLRFSVACRAACEVAAELRHKGRKVGAGRKTLLAPGTAKVSVKLSGSGKRRLRRLRRATVSLKVSVKYPAGTAGFTKTIALRR